MEAINESKMGLPKKSARSMHVVMAMLVLGASAFAAGEVRAQDAEHETRSEEVRDDAHQRWNHPRLRLGISGAGGGFFGADHGGLGGVQVRVGVQFTDMVAVYLQGQGLVGEYLPDPRPTSVAGFVFHSAMIELTLFDRLQLGAGPSIDVLWGCASYNTGTVCGNSGAFYGGDLRVAVVLGHGGPGRRHGLTLSIDAHPTWIGRDVINTMLFGLGGELY